MQIVGQVAAALQRLLGAGANEEAEALGVIRRRRKFTGASLVRTLVLGWLAEPRATLEQLAQQAGLAGVAVTPQAVARRFNDRLAELLQRLVERAVVEAIAAEPVAIPLLQKFRGVFVQDGTVVDLPSEFADRWRACGGTRGQSDAALKIQVRWDVSSGQLQRVCVTDGRSADVSSPIQNEPLPAGSLRLADLGYFDLEHLAGWDQAGVFWITRIQPGTAVFDAAGTRLELGPWLEAHGTALVEQCVQLGVRERLSCRLIAIRAPEPVVRRRIARLDRESRRRGRSVSARQRAWAHWTILATNVPVTLTTWQETYVLYRVRWQIELLFKLWKSQLQLDKSVSRQPARILCELWAKLLAAILQHWLTLTTVWEFADRSLTKTAAVLRQAVTALALALDSRAALRHLLDRLRQSLRRCCRINPRHQHPNTCELLRHPHRLDYALS
jgi:hypothetical protein